MPSGPKKRKAARKKKEKEHDDHSDPSSPAAHSHEVDEGKHQDDRESDVGELSSPALSHRSHRNLLSDGEEEEIEIEDSCSTVPSVEALKIDDSEGANIVMEDENAGEVKREFEIGESDKKDERIEYDEPLNKSEDGGSSDSSGGSSISNSDDESNGIKNTRNVDVYPVHDSVKAAAAPEGSSKTLHSDTIGEAGDSSYPIEKSADCCAVESVLNENEEGKISSFEQKVHSVALTDAASEMKDEEATIRPIEKTATVSDPKAFETQESGHTMTQSYNPAGAKDSAVSEALLAAASHPENTSWKTCCGLFEVFARSDI
ncbi:uncharacterized protein [Primulina huaijiensis]|uniref:uncharacterized protein n=1 Tax=Primulina huaijiensis TaxID=1492673 RepID=UPI003CC70D86